MPECIILQCQWHPAHAHVKARTKSYGKSAVQQQQTFTSYSATSQSIINSLLQESRKKGYSSKETQTAPPKPCFGSCVFLPERGGLESLWKCVCRNSNDVVGHISRRNAERTSAQDKITIHNREFIRRTCIRNTEALCFRHLMKNRPLANYINKSVQE